jgi:DNA replication protein DnaC
MIDQQTLEKLRTMRLHAMADFLQATLLKGGSSDLSSAEQIGMMVDHEWTARDNRRMGVLLKNAKIPANACVEDIWCEPARGLDKSVIRALATCQWVRAKQNVIVVGKTGVGKTFIGASLAQAACRAGFRALCTRTPRLLHELAIARADGSFSALLQRLAKTEVLVLDDFLISPMKDAERRDLLEVLEDRYDRSATVITSQVLTKDWYEMIDDPTVADAICDRLVHNAHVLSLKGPSIRQRKALKKSEEERTTTT